MKLLERVCLLQFFLYEKEDLDIGRNTAFLGPNGTGKTCLLDAVQTVFLGADTGRIHFNAQADGKRRDRSLRSYCLGIYDQRGHGCRSESNTYIALVFRDEATQAVVTAGVALSARQDSPDHTFHGLFILPGVDLKTSDLIDTSSGRPQVMQWKDAQFKFKSLVREGGATAVPVVTQNREEFLRKLLLEHLAAPGDHPNVAMFRNAFQRSLQLKVMDDLSTALRDNLIEARPTKVRQFRERVDQFRQMRDLVRRVREQIAAVEAAGQAFGKVRTQRSREVNFGALGATFEVERQGRLSAELEDLVDDLSKRVAHADAEELRAHAQVSDARVAEQDAVEARSRDLGHQGRGASAAIVADRQRGANDAKAGFERELTVLLGALGAVQAHPDLAGHAAVFADAAHLVMDVLHEVNQGSLPDTSVIARLALKSAEVVLPVRALVSATEQELRGKEQARDTAVSEQQRSAAGLSKLAPEVELLRRKLAAGGVTATPVCDLVEITDGRWQPIIESYLGKNAQALIVERANESAALTIYRQLAKSDDIYNAKVVLPSRVRAWHANGPGHFAGDLVRGDHADAVAFLRGELGQTQCVETNEQLRSVNRGFTVDGMLAAGGTVERRRLPTKLQIGRTDHEASRLEAIQVFKDAMLAVEECERRLQRARAVERPLLRYASEGDTASQLGEQARRLTSALSALSVAQDTVAAGTSDELRALDENVRRASEAFEAAQKHATQCTKDASRFGAECVSAQRRFDEAQVILGHAAAVERAARDNAHFSANEVNRLREQMESGDEGDEALLIETCKDRSNKAGRAAVGFETDARHALSRYRLEFGVNADVGPTWEEQEQFAYAEHLRLSTLTLAEKEQEAENALRAAEQVFRTDVVQALLSGFDRLTEQVAALNKVLQKAPEFSNRERYHFVRRPLEPHRALYEFLQDARDSDPEDSLWNEPTRLPPEFRDIMESDVGSPLLSDNSPLYDYRRFYSYDIEIKRSGEPAGVLSKRFGPGSGGEHRTPLYVIFGAALAASYGNVHGRNAGGGLMLLDEAFDKMDATNVRAVADYLNSLGLQLVMAGPETDQPKLSGFLDMYYDMSRHGSSTIHFERYLINDDARVLLASDNPLLHPELLDQEMERFRAQQDLRKPPSPDGSGDAPPVG